MLGSKEKENKRMRDTRGRNHDPPTLDPLSYTSDTFGRVFEGRFPPPTSPISGLTLSENVIAKREDGTGEYNARNERGGDPLADPKRWLEPEERRCNVGEREEARHDATFRCTR